MLITEKNLRKALRKILLEHERSQVNLDEGIFDFISDFFGSIAASLTTGLSSAEYESSGRASAESESLSPETNVYDQVYLLGDVIWHVGAGVDLALQVAESALEYLEELEFPDTSDESEMSSFFDEVKYSQETAARSVGHLKKYWENSKSEKIIDIAKGIEAPSSGPELMETAAEAIKDLESIDPTSEWEKIKNSQAVKNELDNPPEEVKGGTGEPMQKLIDWGDRGAEDIKSIDELKSLYEKIYELLVEVDEVTKELGASTGATPEQTDLL